MNLQLEGRSALVTGGTRGIGQAIVISLANEGCTVVATGSRPESIEAARPVFHAFADRVALVACDMSDHDAASQLPLAAHDQFGRLDIVVNNAARLSYDEANGGGVGIADWHQLINTKLLGYSVIIEKSLDLLSTDGGTIINIGGMASVSPSATSPHSAAVNAGINAMSRGYARRAAKKGIRINVITPGSTATDRFEARAASLAANLDGNLDLARQQLNARVPLGRAIAPAEIGTLVAMMASPLLRSLTGSNVLIDGGMTLAT